ncbi:MAG TPA: conjugal transfer protein TraR [Treponema sp.]|jgi:RNA polymerase-binding protein DksA|nr:conjugal transfer protein TraR [Treponema sp.]HBD68697.1 conjugal transfer protein TraR [Treponema sp.]
MRKDFPEKQKKKLLAQRSQILESLAAQSEAMSRLVEGVESGDEVDKASGVIDRTLLDSLGAADAARLTAIDNAIVRINQGKYGLCLQCGRPIPEARLEAIPYAALCVNCQTVEEKKNR